MHKKSGLVWLRAAAVLAVCLLLAAAWKWTPAKSLDPQDVSRWMAPHRHQWYALPIVALLFVVFALVPVFLLIAATGIAFGPILGPLYAMAGCLTSASLGFGIGRLVGLRRLRELGGERMARFSGALKRNGVLAVLFVRKVPAPFLLANIVVGASAIRYRDFVLGTFLGMLAFVVAVAGFGFQLTKALHHPTPWTFVGAGLFVGLPLLAAWLTNRLLRRAT